MSERIEISFISPERLERLEKLFHPRGPCFEDPLTIVLLSPLPKGDD
jgi:hypothetical protein